MRRWRAQAHENLAALVHQWRTLSACRVATLGDARPAPPRVFDPAIRCYGFSHTWRESFLLTLTFRDPAAWDGWLTRSDRLRVSRASVSGRCISTMKWGS